MWLYQRVAAQFGEKPASVAVVIYYALILTVTLVFALEPQTAFRYAQL